MKQPTKPNQTAYFDKNGKPKCPKNEKFKDFNTIFIHAHSQELPTKL